ncbi:MAG: ATP-binding protein [Nitriliruptorales bacterium]
MSLPDARRVAFARPDTAAPRPSPDLVASSQAPAARGSANGVLHEHEFLDLLPDAYVATDCAGRILATNVATYDLLGLPRHELVGSSLFDFVAPEDAAGVAAVLEGEASAVSSRLVETRLRLSGGRSIVAELRANPGRQDGRRMWWLVRDVTAQRLRERALHEEVDRYRQLGTRLPVLTYSLDRENPVGVATFVSPRMAELFGLAADDENGLGERWIRQIHPEDRGRVLTERARAGANVTAMRCEYRVLTTDGRVRRVRDEVHVASSGSGPRLEGVIVDVTSRGGGPPAPARVEPRRGGNPDAPGRVGSRRGGVSSSEDGDRRTFLRLFLHDVRSPLAVAVAIIETLLREEEGLAAEQRRDLLTGAVENLQHIHQLLSEVVDIERLEQRQVAVRLEPTDVTTVVEHAVRKMGESAETGHPIEFAAAGCIAHTDASLVERAVAKLLENAFAHTPPETGIWVAVEAVDEGVLVSVEDEGPGVPDELKERIFQAFDRGQAPATTAGFGLGLALVRHIVHVLGGQAWVEDRPGGGASFRLFLPSEQPSRG